MAISPHLHRKLREALGADAGDDLVNLLEVAQATRGDIAELRQETRLRFAETDAKFPVLKAELQGNIKELERSTQTAVVDVRAALERGLKEQTRFLILAWSVLLAMMAGLYAR